MLEITSDQIAKLNDEDLRTLVARLCEAELSALKLPLSAVTAGGNQTAADGGLDVRVDLKLSAAGLDFVPTAVTGFQVKCSDMPRKKIESEMRPNGHLRPSIKDLASAQGAYVIVSSQGSTADKALTDRRNAMREAVRDLSAPSTIHLDFYDRDRVARWARRFPGVGLWIRERINEPRSGWRGYGNWAFGDQPGSEYLQDDTGRIVSRKTGSHKPLSVEKGIAMMREIIAKPGGVIRLIGLSGTGKTRLAQALFDPRVGCDAPDSSLVVYVDQGQDSPTPSAREMIQQLGATGTRSIVVVDNCNPETHRALAHAVASSPNSLSLLTVEYDVADDEPEETEVFQLEPASEKVLDEIIQRLVPHLSALDRHRIASAEISGGNARIALAIAKTIGRSESLGRLNDLDLFKRLFHQRQDSSDMLMRVAEACSLVYSFDGVTHDCENAELAVLAELSGVPIKEAIRHLGTLRRRDLLQSRSKWRAILPHAIANRLACFALESLSPDEINRAFWQAGRERLLKSLCRRLSYLHDCPQAVALASQWLSGPIAGPARLNGLGLHLFHSLAPLVPELVLRIIDETIQGETGSDFLSPEAPNRQRWAALLHSLAYEPESFDQAAFLFAKFRAAEPEGSTNSTFKELFYICLSGTQARCDQRLRLVRKLLQQKAPRLQSCGLQALDAMLESRHFTSSRDFSFGARPRDFGWEPATDEEQTAWFRETLSLVRELAGSKSSHHDTIKKILGRRLRTLWTYANVPDDLEILVSAFNAGDGWPDGWIAVRSTLRSDRGCMPTELAVRLSKLEEVLRPRDLLQKIQAYVLSKTHQAYEIVDSEIVGDSGADHQAAWDRVCRFVEELGRETANAPEILNRILPDLLSKSPGQRWQFGRGMAAGTADLEELWKKCRNVLAAIHPNHRDVSLLSGIVEEASRHHPEATCRLMDEAVTDSALGPHFPILQASYARIDTVGARRVLQSLRLGMAPASAYQYLGHGRVSESIPPALFSKIVLGVIGLPDGYRVAVHLVTMRFFSAKNAGQTLGSSMLRLGRTVLLHADFQEQDDVFAYHLNEIAERCLVGEGARLAASKLSKKLARALLDYRTGARHYHELLRTLFSLHPLTALDAFLDSPKKKRLRPLSRLMFLAEESPVNAAPPEILFSWTDKHPNERYPALAEEIRLFGGAGKNKILRWSPVALCLLEQSPDKEAVLEVYESRFSPTHWSGSRGNALAPYLRLAEQMRDNSDPRLAAWGQRMQEHLAGEIERDHQRDKSVDESFE